MRFSPARFGRANSPILCGERKCRRVRLTRRAAKRLLQHKDEEIRDIAAKVFAKSSSPDRGKLVDDYILTLPEKADAGRGAKLFAKSCAVCHKLGDAGQQVGPDLASVGDKSIQGLLVAILDPNRTVEARYVNYLAITKDGRTLNGMIASETSTSVTLVGVDGKSHALLRNQIDELTSTGKSMMPEGLEKDLPPQEMADLLAFIRASLPTPKGKGSPQADDDEAVRFDPGAAEPRSPPAGLSSRSASLTATIVASPVQDPCRLRQGSKKSARDAKEMESTQAEQIFAIWRTFPQAGAE